MAEAAPGTSRNRPARQNIQPVIHRKDGTQESGLRMAVYRIARFFSYSRSQPLPGCGILFRRKRPHFYGWPDPPEADNSNFYSPGKKYFSSVSTPGISRIAVRLSTKSSKKVSSDEPTGQGIERESSRGRGAASASRMRRRGKP